MVQVNRSVTVESIFIYMKLSQFSVLLEEKGQSYVFTIVVWSLLVTMLLQCSKYFFCEAAFLDSYNVTMM